MSCIYEVGGKIFNRDFTTLGLTYRKREVKKELRELEV